MRTDVMGVIAWEVEYCRGWELRRARARARVLEAEIIWNYINPGKMVPEPVDIIEDKSQL
jgi:hypothetical protein